VSAKIDGGDYASVTKGIDGAIKQVDFPLEYRAELLGEFAERLAAKDRIMSMVIAAAILIFLLLQVVLRSWKLAFAIFLTLPMSIVGGVLISLVSSGSVLSLGSYLGFLAVFSIAVRNNIILIDSYRKSENNGGLTFGPELVQEITRGRSTSILITAVITFLAVLPVAIL
jgi:Cu/Ag efflux pump CusA